MQQTVQRSNQMADMMQGMGNMALDGLAETAMALTA